MQLRITAGKYKNKKLKVPDSARPVSSRAKLALFSILGDKIIGAKCIDLFAGSGSLGLEALSRGAKSCVFVDNDYGAIKLINENIKSLDKSLFQNTAVVKNDAAKYIPNDQEYYDVIYFDPPYDLPIKYAIKLIHELIKNDGIILYFHGKNNSIDTPTENPNLKISNTRKYGITIVDFLMRA